MSDEADVFFINVHNAMYISKMKWKFQKVFLVFEIIAFQLLAGFQMLFAINVLKNSPNILQLIQRYVILFNLS